MRRNPSFCSNSGTQIFHLSPETMLWITDFTQQSDEWAADVALCPSNRYEVIM